MTDCGASSPTLHTQGLLTRTPVSRHSSTVLPWGGTGPALQSCAVGEGQGQLCAAPSSLLLGVTGTKHINTDQSCSRAVNLDVAPGPDDTMVPGGNAGHLDSMVLNPHMAQVWVQIPDMCTAFYGDRSLGYQFRSRLW